MSHGFTRTKLSDMKSIQETYAPNLACFGCGPANPKGLHIRSFPNGDEVVAEWEPSKEYEAFEGMLSGASLGRCSTVIATGVRRGI